MLDAGRRATRALRLNQPRRAAVAGGALLLVVIIAAVVLGGRSDDPPLAGTSATPSASTEPVAGPQVPPINACQLLTEAEIDRAMGIEDLPFADRAYLTVAGGEGCSWQNVRGGDPVEGLAVQIAPGSPDDHAPDASLAGVAGASVTGIGSLATWFAGEDEGVLSVADASSFGYVFTRVRLERADIDDETRLELARELAASVLSRLPGMEVVEPTPEPTIIDPEPPDLAGASLVDNLLAGEAAGDWTRGEGLVATLQLLAGEAEADDVLRRGAVESAEGTGIVEMAFDYLASGEDASAQEEIRQLLERLIYSNERLESMAGIDASAAAANVLAAAAMPSTHERAVAVDVVNCAEFYYNFETDEGVGDCVEWWAIGPPGGPADKYRVFVPAESWPQGGWSAAHFDAATVALELSASVFEGMGGLPRINMVFTVVQSETALAAAANPGGGQPCGIFLYTDLQSKPSDDFEQIIAHEVAHCFTAHVVAPQSRVTYPVKRWWEEGVAEYLSNVVYPDHNVEWDRAEILAEAELSTKILDRAYTNFAFFQAIASEMSSVHPLTLLSTLPGCASAQPQMTDAEAAACKARNTAEQTAALAAFGGIRELFHTFTEHLTDESLLDTGGERMPFDPDAVPISATGRTDVLLDAFEVTRLHVSVPDGQWACVTFDVRGGVLMSRRDGEPGGVGRREAWFRDQPSTLRDENVIVGTTLSDGAVLSIDITDIVDDLADCDRTPNGSGNGCVIDICGSSDYYRNPEQLDAWVLDLLPPLSL